jgi:hypothetical protein
MLLSVGLVGTVHETFVVNGERKVLLAVFAAMMGLSGALRLDTLRREAQHLAAHRQERRRRRRTERQR